eukprot:scaffold46981_cov21-Tisochrysis_lutea.AAC.5
MMCSISPKISVPDCQHDQRLIFGLVHMHATWMHAFTYSDSMWPGSCLAVASQVWNVHWGHYKVAPEIAPNLPQWFCFQKDKEDEGSWDGGLYYGFPPEDKDSSSPVIK